VSIKRGYLHFRNIPTLIYPEIPQEFFLVLPFYGGMPQGTIVFHEGFLAKRD
jgi:putative acetyltransferase